MKLSSPTLSLSLEEELVGVQYLSDVVASYLKIENDEEYYVFNLRNIHTKIASMKAIKEVCLSVGMVTGIPNLIHYRVVLFHTPDSSLTDP